MEFIEIWDSGPVRMKVVTFKCVQCGRTWEEAILAESTQEWWIVEGYYMAEDCDGCYGPIAQWPDWR